MNQHTFTHEDVFGAIQAFNDESRKIVVAIDFIDFFEDYNAASVFSRLLYLDTRSTLPDGWVAKSADEWFDETRLTERQIKRAGQILIDRGVIEIEKRKFQGAPTRHYRILKLPFAISFSTWRRNRFEQNVEMDSDQLSISLYTTESNNRVKQQGKNPIRRNVLFANSDVYEWDVFIQKFSATPEGEEMVDQEIDVRFYYNKVKNWSASRDAKRKDWVAVVRQFIMSDIQDNKVKRTTAPAIKEGRVGDEGFRDELMND